MSARDSGRSGGKSSCFGFSPLVVLVVLQLAACWPVWAWYLARIGDGSDEPWGVIALLSALVVVALRGRLQPPSGRALVLVFVATAAYALSYHAVPALLRAAIAVTSISLLLSSCFLGRVCQPAVSALLLLSLPIIASLQFYAGWPTRVFTAHATAWLVSLCGAPVVAEGTCLRWLGELIVVDAPCSGIKMLWASLYLTFLLAAVANLTWRGTWLAYAGAMLCVFIGNVIRAAMLFFLETHRVPLSSWAHEGVGLLTFAAVVAAIFSVHRRLRAFVDSSEEPICAVW